MRFFVVKVYFEKLYCAGVSEKRSNRVFHVQVYPSEVKSRFVELFCAALSEDRSSVALYFRGALLCGEVLL